MSDAVTKHQASAVDDHAARVHPEMQPDFGASLGHAWRGVRHVFRHERNARIHLVLALVVVAAGLGLRLSAGSWAAVSFAIILVFLAEIFNTAIERTLDLIDVRENPQIKMVKDMTAGAVLMTAGFAVVVAVAIFGPAVARWLWGG